jgi:hypothetical protein
MEKKIVPPNTARIAQGFRDTGYSFESAIADLVDNSIEAGATQIEVHVGLDIDDEPVITIADNGSGMNLVELENAMRYGSDPKNETRRLGRFGLGLKTASTSFCKQLVVVTSKGNDGPPVAATWDIDEIERSNEWVLSIGPAGRAETAMYAEYAQPLQLGSASSNSGTVIAWRKVDRLIKKKTGEVKNPKAFLDRKVENLRFHLAMTFQRFLDPDDMRARTVAIRLNGEAVAPWDPFCERFGVNCLYEEPIEITSDKGDDLPGRILVRVFILPKPAENQVEGYKEAARLSGTERQGFFIYREERLVQPASWMDFGVIETHLRGLRIEMSFPATLDEIFSVGLKKSGLEMQPFLRSYLEGRVTGWRREANERDRKGKARDDVARMNSGKSPSNHVIGEHLESLQAPTTLAAGDGSLTLSNNLPSSPVTVLGSGGALNDRFKVKVVTGGPQVYVALKEALDQRNLWEPAIRGDVQDRYQVTLNASHEWLKKAYLPLAETDPTRQAIDFLMFALAMAELNNTDEELRDEFEQFRIEVSRNLEKLSVDLPEHDPD